MDRSFEQVYGSRVNRSAEKIETLRGAVPLAHYFLKERVRPGDAAVDATCGNGFDTLLLAQLVGETGKVCAFDVQPAAIAATGELLEREGVRDRVRLVEAGHERLAEFVPQGIAAAVFNLGYLPGGDTAFVTAADNTTAALEQAAGLLAPRGIVSIALYTGHDGGPEEALAVERWGASLHPGRFNVWRHRQLNRPEHAPYLILVERIR